MEIVVRATAVYFFVWLLTRALGKRELAEMTGFEMVLLIMMGDIVQQGVTQEDMSITGAFVAIGTIGFWVMVFSYTSFRFGKARRALEGVAVVLVLDGRPIPESLRLERIPLDEVMEVARRHGIADLADVRYAVLEPDGRISFVVRDAAGSDESEDERRSV